MKILLIAIVLFGAADTGHKRAECHSQCFTCEVRCRHAADYQSCKTTCLEMKRMCCQAGGMGPGPRTTCDCT